MSSIRAALDEGMHQLANPDARLEAEILLGHVLNKNRAYLFAHPEVELSLAQLSSYQESIQQRKQGMPIAYITGQREFWSLKLKVSPATLIPRHETERLVELALELIPQEQDTAVLDLGTGSGAIALALAKERPNWHIDACDISPEALKIAQENAFNNQLSNISFFQSDWFNAIPQKRYHAIVSNPPYIDPDDSHLKEGDLRFEPINALASSQHGLADLQYIIGCSKEYLLPQGLILLEHGFNQKLQINARLRELGFKNVQTWKDVQGHDRVSGGWLVD